MQIYASRWCCQQLLIHFFSPKSPIKYFLQQFLLLLKINLLKIEIYSWKKFLLTFDIEISFSQSKAFISWLKNSRTVFFSNHQKCRFGIGSVTFTEVVPKMNERWICRSWNDVSDSVFLKEIFRFLIWDCVAVFLW